MGLDGIEVIRGKLGVLPGSPGVYRMLGEDGAVLYVGKARNLKARVTSYTQPERMGSRIRKMVFETRDMAFVETRTEAEALLLEANLIKSLKPKYNVIFRDDASYVSVVITDEPVPVVRSHRGARKAKGAYFGPYPSATAVYAVLDVMERAFRLRSCSDSVFKNRTRPCLKYDIKRCSAPCVGLVSPEDYAKQVRQAQRFLEGHREEVLAELQAQMAAFAKDMRYEDAAVVRDRIKALAAVGGAEGSLSHALGEADVLAIVAEHGRFAVQAFYYRNGQHVGNQVYYFSQPDVGEAEVLRGFIAQHYSGRVPPPCIYCNVMPEDGEVLAEALGLAAGRKVRVEVPQRGEKRDIVAQAEANAEAALRRKRAEADGWARQMADFARVLGVEAVETVECYDISNISGKFPVASGVVAGVEGMLRNRYRRYKVQSKDTPDDFAMMREVLTRRVVRGLKEGGLPDVIMVDGGKGQLHVLVQVLREAGLLGQSECPLAVGIAKGEERDKGLETLLLWEDRNEERGSEVARGGDRNEERGSEVARKEERDEEWGGEVAREREGAGRIRELPVAYGSALIFMLQRIRDEAHRFAITFHRARRAKVLEVSRLDDIPGVGPGKKKALLLHFGSVEGVRNASEKELAKVAGIGPELAKVIAGFFRG